MNAITPIVRIWFIGKDDIDEYWFYVLPLLEKAVRRGNPRISLESTHQLLKEGYAQLFIAKVNCEVKAACVTSFTNYPATRMLTITLCGGVDMHQWLADGMHFIEETAKLNGCSGVEAIGRRGWIRALGMQERSVVCERLF